MNNDNLVEVIITGGTIDSKWNGSKDTVEVRQESSLPEYFKGLKLYNEINFNTVCMKDSREVNDEDRNKIIKIIEESPAKKIIITHGTYTMPDTAKYLNSNMQIKDKTIILFGSFTPLQGFDMSDGGFNLGYAFSQALVLEPGIYVCMNGRTFNPEEVTKDTVQGKFYSETNK